MSDTATVTPWSTATPYATGYPSWVPDEDQERIQAYAVYNNLYWSEDRCIEVVREEEDGQPIYVPRPKMVVDTTAHYLLKGLTISVDNPDQNKEAAEFLQNFLDREAFLAMFNTAKKKGVCLGDWLLHVTADPDQPEGQRVSINSIDPASYFPEYDPDDMETRTGVKIVDQWQDPDDPTKTLVKILRYFYDLEDPSDRRVWREENIWEVDGWNNPQKAKLFKALLPLEALPESITEIPVYHFKNAEWDGNGFGSSELKGVERIFKGLSQAVSDEEIALALVGLGVYATDAGRPVVNGREVDWVISPGKVLEVPGATMMKKLEGITSVTPVQDHLKYLDMVLKEATSTSDVALGQVDAQVAESGIALAIKFLPTAAKIEDRDLAGLAKLKQLWFDLRAWFQAYENFDFGSAQILVAIGEKLPINRVAVLNELNNFLDRKVVSKKWYREEVEKRLGYTFPSDIEQQILDEQVAQLELMQQFKDPPESDDSGGSTGENQSNNRNRTNESNGTEAEDS